MVFNDLQHFKLALYMTINCTDLLIAKWIGLTKLSSNFQGNIVQYKIEQVEQNDYKTYINTKVSPHKWRQSKYYTKEFTLWIQYQTNLRGRNPRQSIFKISIKINTKPTTQKNKIMLIS